jgi:cell division protein FtsL
MKQVLFNLILFVLVLTSALAVVVARHDGRKLFVELQALEKQRDAMNEEWGKLQLEQATWATHARIEEVARTKLGMTPPSPQSIVLVLP